MSKQCSELFFNLFDSGSGSCFRECNCGKIFFDIYNTWDWKDGELENLEIKAQQHPEKYFPINHSIETMNINGLEIVYGCLCDYAKIHEQFILKYATEIAEYLNARSKKLKEEAEAIKVIL